MTYRTGETNLEKGSGHPKLTQTIADVKPLDLLHHELGHLSESRLKRGLKEGYWKGSRFTWEDVKDHRMTFCPSCMEGRMKSFVRLSDPKSQNFELYDKIGMDYKGKFAEKSIDGYNGFYLISDFATNNLFVFFVKSKGEVTTLKILQEFNFYS